jgi:3-phenylpropionate/cinnamic acid dioxygenase small subunit
MTVADELEIRNAIALIAHLADMGTDVDEYIGCFTVDAHWLMPNAPRKGHDDIKAGWLERRKINQTGPDSHSRHHITTIRVEADGSDVATSDSYFIFFVNTTTSPTVQLMGHYHDTWQRSAQGWKLARREITFG